MKHSNRTARCSVVVGAGGQDGQYLCDKLAERGDRVIRVYRTALSGDIDSRPMDILDCGAVTDLVREAVPNEIYYLAAYHHSSEEAVGPLRTLLDKSYGVHCVGLQNFLDAMSGYQRQSRLFYAASSLVFGDPKVAPQTEDTPMVPFCAYGITKLNGIGLCRAFRCNEGLFACAGILYNHESPLRGSNFVTRKIARGVADIFYGRGTRLELGGLDTRVDWSAAEDVVLAMMAMLSMDEPQDLVVSSGTLHTIREFVELAFSVVGLNYRDHVVEVPGIVQRPVRKHSLCGDSTRLRKVTGWQPRLSFKSLVESMVRSELTKH